MKANCQGPCMPHCFKEEKFIYLLVGFLIGIVAYEIINRIMAQLAKIEMNKKQNNLNKPPQPNNLAEIKL